MSAAANARLALRARRGGAKFSLRIVLEARKHNEIPVSLGFALIEQETGFRNIYGHDPTGSVPPRLPRGRSKLLLPVQGGPVTRANYAVYKRRRGKTGRGGMQGVGPGQLTWYSTQDTADRRGGCWVPKHNIAVAFNTLAVNIHQHGEIKGIAAYNGSGAAAVAYSQEVRNKQDKWHRRLT